jgi:hypothetical protein
MKHFKFILVVLVSVALVLLMASCKKSDSGNPAGPDNPATGLYGSGSVSFNTNSTVVGNYNISGSFDPTSYGSSGSGVWCWHYTSQNTVGLYGYVWRSSTDWDYIFLSFSKPTANPLGTGTYNFSENEVSMIIVKGATSIGGSDGSDFAVDAGTANITSFSSTGMKGNFSGTGVGYTAAVMGTEIQITNGSFDVTFGTAAN